MKRKRPGAGPRGNNFKKKGPQRKKPKKGEMTKIEALALKHKKELIRPGEVKEQHQKVQVREEQEGSEGESDGGPPDPLGELLSTFGHNNQQEEVMTTDSEEEEDEETASKEEEEEQEEEDEEDELQDADEIDDDEEEEEDAEIPLTKENPTNDKLPDPFAHFETIIDDDCVAKCSKQSWKTREISTASLGRLQLQTCESEDVPNAGSFRWTGNYADDLAHVKQSLLANLEKANGGARSAAGLTTFQKEMFHLFNSYVDVSYNERTFANGEELRTVYCLHVLNHVLKTRSRVVHHNAKLKDPTNAAEEFRDQGLTRPKVLILVPFRECAMRIVKTMTDLLCHEKMNVINKKRFQREFGSKENHDPKRKKSEDHEAMFAGNSNELFILGMAVMKKSVKLYADFYSADILIADPLGLRHMMGAKGEEEHDFDFLSSVEILLLDQADVFLMQNWDHVLHIFQHLHLQPSDAHGVDFSRVRMWCLNGWSKLYRQTLLFGSVSLPLINALFNKNCCNYSGKVRVSNPVAKGTICRVAAQVPQFFQRFVSASVSEIADVRFQTFTQKILPEYRQHRMSHTMIFVPSYYDFVRVRNYFMKEEINFVQLCEYSKPDETARARDFFFHGKSPFMLYTERAHFYHRYLVRGVKHIIFYELPTFPHFYSELCNRIQSLHSRLGDEAGASCRILYTLQNAQQLSAVVGTERAQTMLSSSKQIHMFVTGDT